MKQFKMILTVCLMLALLAFATGCAQEMSPYEVNDGENYSVSVKFDANGGFFTTNTSVIVDSYNPAEAGDGIALIAPDDSRRGNDAFTAVNNGHFLAGWYTERTEQTDSNGNTVYSYSGKWDFETDRLAVDPAGTYTAAEPVMTLYAAWVPMFEIQFYDLESGEYLESLSFNPTATEEILVPEWDKETGAIEMYDFPARSGYTFEGAYYDAEGTEKVEGAAVVHTGTVDEETGTAQDASMKLYVQWAEGEWYHIYNVEQFLENASVSGSYVIHEDLDFAGEIWPSSMMYGNFSGTIQGNGHTFSNIEIAQTNNSKVNAGLFGHLTETASVEDLTLENVTFTVQSGTRVAGTSFGLFSGTISEGARVEDVKILDSTLQVDSGCYFGVDDYTIGLVCGMGDPSLISDAEITCEAVGDNPESLILTVSGNDVAVEFVSE